VSELAHALTAAGQGAEADRGADARPAGRASAVVSLRGVTRAYGDAIAVRDVDLDVEEREFFTLLGPSGSGKTTILRIIAGLVEPTAGSVSIGGSDVRGLPPYRRNIAVVFQSLALFPHMSVFSNVAFPLRMRRLGRREVATRVSTALETVRLGERFAQRTISQLSGGERQRVALARALVCEPKILLLDEPLAALDRRLREDMQLELVRLHQEIEVTILNVTHDQREALMLSNRIGVMNNGALVQVGPSELMYNEPATRFVAGFIGDATLLDGRIEHESGESILNIAGTRLRIRRSDVLGPASLVVRSELVHVERHESDLGSCEVRLAGRVAMSVFEGGGTYYEIALNVGGPVIKALVPRRASTPVYVRGEDVWVGWHQGDVTLVPGEPDTS
jgi:ABC-type Fe3+/spermidine/putrescine transport system ATPase subunit